MKNGDSNIQKVRNEKNEEKDILKGFEDESSQKGYEDDIWAVVDVVLKSIQDIWVLKGDILVPINV